MHLNVSSCASEIMMASDPDPHSTAKEDISYVDELVSIGLFEPCPKYLFAGYFLKRILSTS